MKTGNAILAIFCWLVAGFLFYFEYINTLGFRVGGGDICILISIVLFIVGFVILFSGIEKEESLKPSGSSNFNYCPQCRNMVGENAVFCSRCGAKLK